MAREDPEAFLRAMVAPLRAARRGGSFPGVPFSQEAVANAFVMLGLLPEASFRFWFWPPIAMAARRIRVIVSTLWEAAWAEIDIPGRPGPADPAA